MEYLTVTLRWGNTDELNRLAAEGWAVVPGTMATTLEGHMVLMQRETAPDREASKRARARKPGPEETK